MKLRYDLVFVTWDDASSLPIGWAQDDEIKPKPELAYTVGFMLKRNKDHLVIASTLDDEKASNHHFQIPRKMIRSQIVIVKRGSEFPTTETQHENPR